MRATTLIDRLLATTTRGWEKRIADRRCAEEPGAVLRDARERLTEILLRNIVPVWAERVPREAHAGLPFLAEERRGRRFLNSIFVSRCLWFFARLADSPYAHETHASLAHVAYRTLAESLYDTVHGGFFWERDLERGVPSSPAKHVYGQAFAIFALARYGKALNDAEALKRASETFALLERHAHDAANGGYVECFERDWSPARAPGYLGSDASVKLANTHAHLLEAATELFEAAPQPILPERIVELAGILSSKALHARLPVSPSAHRLDWTPGTDARGRAVSYGHEVQMIHLLVHAYEALGMDPSALAEPLGRRFAYCMRFGFDFRRGGFFDRGPPRRRARRKAKIWWVQAEALLGALTMYRLTHHPVHLSAFEKTLGWVTNAQVDWSGGEWHREIDERGRPRGPKIDRWKCPYHNGRAMLECLATIEALGGDPA